MKNRIKRNLLLNKNASFPVLETLISIGICVTLLTIFFTSLNSTYKVDDRPGINLDEKSLGIIEQIIGYPGQIFKENSYWEDDPSNVNTIGFGTTPLVAYGIIYIVPSTGEIISIGGQYSFLNSDIGDIKNCFLEGTKVLMADGLYKNIEEIKIGDFVKSYDERNAKIACNKVTNIFYKSADENIYDYYILINKKLGVTPDQKFYSEGKWIDANDLKIGDSLFYPISDSNIFSIEKIYNKKSVYDLEIDNFHNFFVKMDFSSVLVHNTLLHANFTWFDYDGLDTGTNIFYDTKSSLSTVHEDNLLYEWDWESDGIYDTIRTDNETWERNLGTGTKIVTLRVTDSINGLKDTCTKAVIANTFQGPDLRNWIKNDFNSTPSLGNDTFGAYNDRYLVQYTDMGGNYYLYEVKEKTNSEYSVLDYHKISSLRGITNQKYHDFKTSFGLNNSRSVLYNFNISFSFESSLPISYGASYANSTITESNTREVLIYHKPVTSGFNITQEPYYEKAKITVRVFIGGSFD